MDSAPESNVPLPDPALDLEWARIVRLRVIRHLTSIIRRWYRVEIAFSDSSGYVRAFEGNRIFEPTNAVCRLVLNTREGFRQCIASSREAHDLVKKIGKPGARGFQAGENRCHMGFRQIAVPIDIDGKRIGSVIAGGLLPHGQPEAEGRGWGPAGGAPGAEDEAVRREIGDAAAAFGIEREAVENAFAHLPRIDDVSLEYLLELVDAVVKEVVQYHHEVAEKERSIARLADQLAASQGFGRIIGSSKPMRDMMAILERVAPSDSTVLLQGENGTGKELLARALHWHSPRRDKPFTAQSAAAFNENLLESELFGHVKGSFTGAVKDKKGLAELADGGTFFLDEVGEMSPAMQVKILRLLQEGTFTPVGSTEVKRVNVRFICATNRDLRRMVERGEFREDLYYRINVINVHVPPLRDRRDDIPLLVKHFLKALAVDKKEKPKEVHPLVMDRFFDYEWPGNIRELENEVERLVVLAGDDPVITADLLSARIKERSGRANVRGVRIEKTLDEILEEVERRVLTEGLRKTRWNKTQLAKQLGISRKGLIAKVQRYQLDRRKDPR